MEHMTPMPGISRRLKRWRNGEALRRPVRYCLDGLTAFVLSAAAAGATPLPLCLGFLAGMEADWSAITAACGACAGYLLFWGTPACLEPLGCLVAGLLAVAVFSGTELRRRQWFLPALCAGVTAALGLVFLLGRQTVAMAELGGYALKVAAAAASAAVFSPGEAPWKRPWAKAMVVLGLCQFSIFQALDLGIAAAALLALPHGGLLPAALLGAAVDLSRITPVPMTPVICLASLTADALRERGRGLWALTPALWSFPAMYLAGRFDASVPLSLLAGGAAGLALPQSRRPARPRERGEDGPAPGRLEAAAGALEYLCTLLEQPAPQGSDMALLFDRAAETACRSCSRWGLCWDREAEETCRLLSEAAPGILERRQVLPEDLPEAFQTRCRQPEAFAKAADQAMGAVRLSHQYRQKLRESQLALCNQYRFLARYLRDTAGERDGAERLRARYRVELGVGAVGKFGPAASGDRGAHFPGPGQTYYVLLCDGMGAGPGAAGESDSALKLLTGMLQAGMLPGAALETLNDLYVLRETGGFSTAEVLELRLDTGRAALYKWGAAPSYLKHRRTARKMGTAAPPPGVGIGEAHQAEVIRLSLQREEMVVLVSDGLAGEETRERIAEFTGQSPKALAAMLAAGATDEDDCTAVAVCLRPLSSSTA